MPKAKNLPILQKLNPIRVGLTKDLKQLRRYRYSGHAVLIRTLKYDWPDKDYVLRFFGSINREARKLNITLSAVSKAVSRAQSILGEMGSSLLLTLAQDY